ncbi:hypothetical protein [Brevibacillus laterosporus]|uniref:hypothetical protein n=1 Tax=Brevibacillus laterosporus TaxID=1465 RepID=UPI00264B3B72|nr:hypothetical protein [Brevibacillus laterosporus]MDN9010618.1 hypothetical protein [Brevibacillus laterosporus]MDO0941473.1 hypothetical protein [Brevibacillus laterosporus]
MQIRYANLSALKKLADEILENVPIYEQMKKLLEQAEQTNGLYALAYLPTRVYMFEILYYRQLLFQLI